ncbi:hypothetical protein TCAL_01172 [Tigriopus californicus]|uniref:Uncharacterized protein n=1 Tax=Tigriopus californicus TaxID=6832 RepID=A0A553P078_TIGCA|nr:nitric oxide-associated protein 1-like [Tigriopus californicus]TRY71077.1 hypothetical protein TCAL_01172 [Tigriopus californicus]|eukprot:TCALIF_01172-PA protein Name:"Similar to Noa1 Nitric oxide-associated protein 1 (Mus musculus)" AED:0.14 eAED:0.14 QI:0/-1/0/1/-1/1/1/0/751
MSSLARVFRRPLLRPLAHHHGRGLSRLELRRSVNSRAQDLLIYGSEVDGLLDPTLKRSSAREIQTQVFELKKRNEDLALLLRHREDDNLSVALPHLFGGAALVQRGAEATPVETIELESHALDDTYRPLEPPEEQPPVYPYDIVHQLDLPGRGGRISDSPTVDDGLGRRRRRPARPGQGVPAEPDHEVISDLVPPDRPEPRSTLSEDEIFRYGTADPEVPASQVPCGGCGAHLHCQDPKAPGFLPTEMFLNKKESELRLLICQRCYVIREYNIALKMNVSPEDYPLTIEHVKHHHNALILLIVDLTDFPGSVWPNIFEMIGTNKRVLLVGNKADLLPQDSSDYLKRVQKAMDKAFLEKCNSGPVQINPRVVSSILVSARTGFNMENLVSRVFKSWDETRNVVGGDVYLIGTTNVGKSSIFNVLLESDLCKIKAIDNVEKAMVSPVPGTTLNLLKFPLMRPDPHRIYMRFQRLKKTRHVFRLQEIERMEKLRHTRSRKYSGCRGPPIANTLIPYQQDKYLPLTGGALELETRTPDQPKLPKRLDPMDPDFAHGKWCYDTPGSVSYDQIINLLTQEEIGRVLPDFPIRPRSFNLRLGQTIFLGGLGRMDLIEGPFEVHPLLVTVFCSDFLPINIVRTEDAEEFYRKSLGTEIMGVPMGNTSRLKDFPPLKGQEFLVDSVSVFEATCDVVLSSAGWIMPSPKVGIMAKVKAWTPDGKGLFLRDPPFLPYAQNLRGKRIGGTPTYRNDKFFTLTL